MDNLHAPFDPPIVTAVELTVEGDPEPAAATSGEAVAVSLTEFALDPPQLDLAAGSVTFEGVNDGAIPHGLVIEGEGIRAGTAGISYAPGTSQSFSAELAPGTCELYCPVPGHKDAGMSATVTVAG